MKNQCDGCCSGMKIVSGIHYYQGRPVMTCEKDKYSKKK